jgi:hypothetical protein
MVPIGLLPVPWKVPNTIPDWPLVMYRMNKINSGRINPKLLCPTFVSRGALEPADCDFDWGFHFYHPQQHEIQDTQVHRLSSLDPGDPLARQGLSTVL